MPTAREFLRITPETTWGTYNGSGTPAIIDLDADNAYTVRPKVIRTTVRTAGAGNRRNRSIANKTGLSGNFNLIVRGSQGAAVAAWLTPASPGAATAAPSMTIDHCILLEDGSTQVYSRDLGVVVAQAQLQCSEQAPLLRAQLQLIGKSRASITSTDFPEPAATDYASDPYYLFTHLASGFTLGSSRSEFDSFSLTVKNMLDARFFASSTITRLRYCGRDVDFSIGFPYKVATDRSNYEGNTPAAASAVFTIPSPSHTLTLQMNSAVYYDGVEDDLSQDKVFMQSCSLQAFFDSAAGTPGDFTITGT